jgi:hypothetical protein
MPVEVPVKNYDLENKILEKIKKREKMFSEAASVQTEKPTNSETI